MEHSAEFGRPAFFLYPPGWMEQELLSKLIAREFQVYSHHNYASILRILKTFPHSILFLNIDGGPKPQEWQRYLKGILGSVKSSGGSVLVLSSEIRRSLIERYTTEMELSSGFISLRQSPSAIEKKIVQFLAALQAKGRRRYIRASCQHSEKASFNIKRAGNVYQGKIVDISVAGMACYLEQGHLAELQMGETIPDIQLRLNTKLASISGTVRGVREDTRRIYVIMFEDISVSTREKIHEFIASSLQLNFHRQIGV